MLVTENPRRALTRFSTTPAPADCLVLSTHTLGSEAVDAFNELPGNDFLAGVPAILLIGAGQTGFVDAARTDARRRVVRMPVPVEEITRLLEGLVARE